MDDQGQPVTLMGAVTFKSLLGFPCPVTSGGLVGLSPRKSKMATIDFAGSPHF